MFLACSTCCVQNVLSCGWENRLKIGCAAQLGKRRPMPPTLG